MGPPVAVKPEPSKKLKAKKITKVRVPAELLKEPAASAKFTFEGLAPGSYKLAKKIATVLEKNGDKSKPSDQSPTTAASPMPPSKRTITVTRMPKTLQSPRVAKEEEGKKTSDTSSSPTVMPDAATKPSTSGPKIVTKKKKRPVRTSTEGVPQGWHKVWHPSPQGQAQTGTATLISPWGMKFQTRDELESFFGMFESTENSADDFDFSIPSDPQQASKDVPEELGADGVDVIDSEETSVKIALKSKPGSSKPVVAPKPASPKLLAEPKLIVARKSAPPLDQKKGEPEGGEGPSQQPKVVRHSIAAEVQAKPAAAKVKTPVAEKPKTPVAEKPKTPVTEKPKTPVAGKPKTSTAEKPKTSTAEKPKVTAVEKPKASTAEKPKVTATEKSKVTASEKSKVTAAEKPKASDAEVPDIPAPKKAEPPPVGKPKPETSKDKTIPGPIFGDVTPERAASIIHLFRPHEIKYQTSKGVPDGFTKVLIKRHVGSLQESVCVVTPDMQRIWNRSDADKFVARKGITTISGADFNFSKFLDEEDMALVAEETATFKKPTVVRVPPKRPSILKKTPKAGEVEEDQSSTSVKPAGRVLKRKKRVRLNEDAYMDKDFVPEYTFAAYGDTARKKFDPKDWAGCVHFEGMQDDDVYVLFRKDGLPEGWKKFIMRRMSGPLSGAFGVYFESPEGWRFWNEREITGYFKERGKTVNLTAFAFKIPEIRLNTVKWGERFNFQPHDDLPSTAKKSRLSSVNGARAGPSTRRSTSEPSTDSVSDKSRQARGSQTQTRKKQSIAVKPGSTRSANGDGQSVVDEAPQQATR